MKKKTSLADIAKALGVSKTLVSMVLNGKGDANGINEDTQKRVWEKAKELNYKPNMMARSLRTGRSHTIGLVVSDISNSFYAKMCRAVEDAAGKKGYYVLFGSSDENANKEGQLIQMLRDRAVDGLILSTTMNNTEDIKELENDEFPLVLIDRFLPEEKTPFVTADNYAGSKEAINHLLSKGKERIAVLKISPSHLTSITERVRGYEDALKENNLPINDDWIVEIPYDDIESSIASILPSMLEGPDAIQAIFTLNNNLATATMAFLHERGIRIPEDLALISFDDIDLFRFSQPSVTAVSQPIRGMGTQAVEMLINKIENGIQAGDENQVFLPTDLIVRGSCG